MNGRVTGWILSRLVGTLRADEQEFVLGDLAEESRTGWDAVAGVLGLAARRHVEQWRQAGPWVALVGIVGGSGMAIAAVARTLAIHLSLQVRTWQVYGERYHSGLSGGEEAAALCVLASASVVWAWMAGFLVSRLAGKAAWVNCGLLAVLWAGSGYVGTVLAVPVWLGWKRGRPGEWPVGLAVVSVILASVVGWMTGWQAAGVERWSEGAWHRQAGWDWRWIGIAIACWPAIYVLARSRMRQAMKLASMAVIAMLVGNVQAAEGIKTELILEQSRNAAPDFALNDAKGKAVKLSALRGKVVLVNFWATYCGGCKVEIPWFQEFENTMGKRGLVVVGLSLDEGGWKDVAPYVAMAGVKYSMLIADKAVLDKYAFDAMPATFLVDKRGRIAARYIGLVDRADIEGKIRSLLAP
ncbi:MAG: TlpA disulfide reductase family protein [Acidobacteriota bacterium]